MKTLIHLHLFLITLAQYSGMVMESPMMIVPLLVWIIKRH